jgi:hypothetical protein
VGTIASTTATPPASRALRRRPDWRRRRGEVTAEPLAGAGPADERADRVTAVTSFTSVTTSDIAATGPPRRPSVHVVHAEIELHIRRPSDRADQRPTTPSRRIGSSVAVAVEVRLMRGRRPRGERIQRLTRERSAGRSRLGGRRRQHDRRLGGPMSFRSSQRSRPFGGWEAGDRRLSTRVDRVHSRVCGG